MTVREFLILDCCNYQIKTGTKFYQNIDCYKLKSKKEHFKKKLSDLRPVKKEIMLVSVCQNCSHYIIRFLFYANANARFQDWDESYIIRGHKADEIFARRCDFYKLINLPNPFEQKVAKRYSKHPSIYYKNVDGYSQIPRYMDESGDAGLKVACPVKVFK